MKDIYLGSNSLNNGLSLDEYSFILNKFEFYGGKIVDTATNYPINDTPKDFMLNVSQLFEIMSSSKMLIKLGASMNDGSPNNLLNVEYLTMQRDALLDAYGNKIAGFGIHWDNDLIDRKDVCKFLEDTHSLGLLVSLSGIKNIQRYSKYLDIPIDYQIRASFCDNYAEKVAEIKKEFKKVDVVGYGIYGGKHKRCGITNLTNKEIVSNLKKIDKVIIMPSSIEQLGEYYD